MNPEIPGYYFDEEKKKYFKIQKNHSTPAGSAYSVDAVKKRKSEDQARRAAQERALLVKNHIKRHPIGRDLVQGGLLAREAALGRVAENGRGQYEDEDIVAAAWAGGVVSKGVVPFLPSRMWARCPNLPCFYVGGEETETSIATAYAFLDKDILMASHVPTNANDQISFSSDARGTTRPPEGFHNEMIRCQQVSSIKYHAPSGQMILTSGMPDESCGLWLFAPYLSDYDPRGPDVEEYWVPGMTDRWRKLNFRHNRREEQWFVNSTTPAPESSDLICVVGTNSGIVEMHSNETMQWTAPRTPPKGDSSQTPHEIFSQDFQQGNHNVVYAGGRAARLWTGDLRGPDTQWSHIKHASSIAHVRSVNPHQVLVSGLCSSMALYDMRFVKQQENGSKPLLLFPEHCNDAYFHIGWDVDTRLGVVAAAQDNGTVHLFSLRSGRRIANPSIDSLASETPLKSLSFTQMQYERLPSLFVGVGPTLRKFSFGVEDVDDEA